MTRYDNINYLVLRSDIDKKLYLLSFVQTGWVYETNEVDNVYFNIYKLYGNFELIDDFMISNPINIPYYIYNCHKLKLERATNILVDEYMLLLKELNKYKQEWIPIIRKISFPSY